jgi:hypothetical protein
MDGKLAPTDGTIVILCTSAVVSICLFRRDRPHRRVHTGRRMYRRVRVKVLKIRVPAAESTDAIGQAGRH